MLGLNTASVPIPQCNWTSTQHSHVEPHNPGRSAFYFSGKIPPALLCLTNTQTLVRACNAVTLSDLLFPHPEKLSVGLSGISGLRRPFWNLSIFGLFSVFWPISVGCSGLPLSCMHLIPVVFLPFGEFFTLALRGEKKIFHVV